MLEPMQLANHQAGRGRVSWIGIRPERRASVQAVEAAEALEDLGLRGDHFAGKPGSDRQVTLVQHEHLDVVASILGSAPLDPGLLRRNISVSGINLLSLVGRKFRIGEAVMEGAGPCRPCSRMEENLGHGGWNAMRGHGGIIARVVRSGLIRTGDEVADLGPVESADPSQSADSS